MLVSQHGGASASASRRCDWSDVYLLHTLRSPAQFLFMLPVCAFCLLPCYYARGSGAVGVCRASYYALVFDRLAETHARLLLDAVVEASSTSTDGVEPTPSIVNFSAP